MKPINVNYCGQGLYHSYCVMIFGNGHNNYCFTVADDDVEYKIYFNEMHITTWTIAIQPFESPNRKPFEYIEFNGYGKLENKGYFWFSQGDCDDFNHIYSDKKFKIIDITIEIENDNNAPIITNITNENLFCNLLDEKNKSIAFVENNWIGNYDVSKMCIVDYDTWITNYDVNKTYYFIIDCYPKMIIPFKVVNVQKSIDGCDDDIVNVVNVVLEYGVNYNVVVNLVYNRDSDDSDDSDYSENSDYNIRISFKIENDILDVFDFCYIME